MPDLDVTADAAPDPTAPALQWRMPVDLTRHAFARRQLWMLVVFLAVLLTPVWLVALLASDQTGITLTVAGVCVGALILVTIALFWTGRNSYQEFVLDAAGVTARGPKKKPSNPVATELLRTVGIIVGAGSAVAAAGKLQEPYTFQRFMAWEHVRSIRTYPEARALTVHRAFPLVSVAVFCPDDEAYEVVLQTIRERTTATPRQGDRRSQKLP